jgi:hypothetical protein
MRCRCAVAFLWCSLTIPLVNAQQTNLNDAKEILIGRLSYFDFGPPFDFYDVIRLQENGSQVRVERVLLTPQAGCFQPAKAEFGEGVVSGSVRDLLAGVDPCRISDRQIEKERKRRKKGQVFSGVNVTVQLQCGPKARVLTADVLDRDLYAAHPDTPQVTSWSMQVLTKLDAVLGPGAADKPIFDLSESTPGAPPGSQLDFVGQLQQGQFDGLFPSAADLPSKIYSDSKKPQTDTAIKVVFIEPGEPDTYVAARYPPIAKAARVEGDVSFHARTGGNCGLEDVTVSAGPKMLHGAVIDSVQQWKFCKLPIGTEVRGTIKFQLNCPATINSSVSQSR